MTISHDMELRGGIPAQPTAPTMEKWDNIICTLAWPLGEALAKRGEDGWELTGVVYAGSDHFHCFFKRPKGEVVEDTLVADDGRVVAKKFVRQDPGWEK